MTNKTSTGFVSIPPRCQFATARKEFARRLVAVDMRRQRGTDS
jgi:hypothetical protein